MQMQSFAEMVRTAVEKELGQGFSVGIEEVVKNNGICLKGLVIRETGYSITPTIYLEDFLEAYEAGISLSGIVRRLLQAYQENKGKAAVNLGFLNDFKEVQDRICYQLVSREGNERFLGGIPNLRFLDLAVCFYYAYSDDSVGDGCILLHNSHMEVWGTCAEELYRLAQENTPRLFPWRCCTIKEILKEAIRERQEKCGTPRVPDEPGQDGIPLKVITNNKRQYGAACILYPGMLEEAAEKMGGDFYIIPGSVHELLILPCDWNKSAEEIKRMINKVNSTQIAAEEILSYSLYRYDAEKKELAIV